MRIRCVDCQCARCGGSTSVHVTDTMVTPQEVWRCSCNQVSVWRSCATHSWESKSWETASNSLWKPQDQVGNKSKIRSSKFVPSSASLQPQSFGARLLTVQPSLRSFHHAICCKCQRSSEVPISSSRGMWGGRFFCGERFLVIIEGG